MPWVDAAEPGDLAPEGVRPPSPASFDFVGALGPQILQSNSVVNVLSKMREDTFPADPEYTPLKDTAFVGTKYQQFHDSNFVGSRSAAESQSIMRKIDGEEERNRTIQAAGAGGTLAGLAAGFLDPINWIVPFGEAKGLVTGGVRAITSPAIRTAAGFGAQTLASEGVLQGAQETRTAGESAMAVGSATLLGAILGPAFNLLAGPERAAIAAKMDADRASMTAHSNGPAPAAEPAPPPPPAAPPLIPEAVPQPASVGAAVSDTRQLDTADFLLNRIPFLGKAIEKISPLSRVFGSSALPARRDLAELADIPTLFEQNLRGETTTLHGGPPVEIEARLANDQNKVSLASTIDSAYSDYRFGEQKSHVRARAAAEDFLGRGEGKMSLEQFKTEVANAAMNGDTHAIPQVAEVAKAWRAQIAPWTARAEKVIEEFKPKEFPDGQSYFPHIYDKTKIDAQRPEFTNIVVGHLAADQADKANIKGRLQSFDGALKSHEATIEKLTSKLEAKQQALEADTALRDEVSRLNKFAFQRAETMRESQFRNDGGIRVDVPGKGIERARGGAVFETKIRERGNTLADRASAHAAEVDQLETQLKAEHDNAIAMRAKIEDEIGKWEGKSTSEAKSAIKARQKYEAERAAAAAAKGEEAPKTRLSSADDAIDKAVQNIIESDRDLTVPELRDKAHEIVQHIQGSPAGRFNYDTATSPNGMPQIGFSGGEPPRGSLHSRDFDIPTALIKDFIETDIEHVNNAWMKTVIPDVLLSERFGDVAMNDTFRKVQDHYAALTDATKSQAQRDKLAKEERSVIRDLAGIRDRVRGVYGLDVRAMLPNAARITDAIKNANVPLSLGSAALSSLADAAGVIFRYGTSTVFGDGYMPWLRSIGADATDSAYKGAKADFKAMAVANDVYLSSRHHQISDIQDNYRPQSRLERTLQWSADKFQLVSGLAQWTDWQKTIAGTVFMANLLRAVEASAKGGQLTKKQLMMLGESNINPQLATRIHAAWTGPEGGKVIDGVRLANSANWTDKSARDAFEGALMREANISVATPGQERPLAMSVPILNTLFQFQSYTVGATQRILIANLQRRDAQVLQGLMFSLSLGMMSYKLNSLTGGQLTSDNPADWLKEGMSRANTLGILENANAFASKMSGGAVDIYRLAGSHKPLSRYANRSALDQLLGPTAGKIEDILKGTSAAGRGDWNAGDTHAMRRTLIYGQNLPYVRGLLNQVESAVNQKMGVPDNKPQ